jgi:hypothetical protein
MSTSLARNVEAYDPETDPAKIDSDSLRSRGWPSSVLDCIVELQQLDLRAPMFNWEPDALQEAAPYRSQQK